MGALPTGDYRAVLLWAKRRGVGKFYILDFVLESGERCKCMVFFKDMAKVFCAAGFVMNNEGVWLPLNPGADQQLVKLSLRYSPKFNSTNAVSATRTGITLACDILLPVGKDYSEF